MSSLQLNYFLIRWPNARFANKSGVSEHRLICSSLLLFSACYGEGQVQDFFKLLLFVCLVVFFCFFCFGFDG